MPDSRMDDAPGGRGQTCACNYGLALAVCSSPINRIVVSRIAEGVGLRALAEVPDSAGAILEAQMPALVILDGGPDNRECEHLMEPLATLRMAAGGRAPFVILLTTANQSADEPACDPVIDAVIAKPITPERLQPLIHRLIGRRA